MRVVQDIDTRSMAENIVCKIMETLKHPSGSESLLKGDDEELYSMACELLVVVKDELDKIGRMYDS